MASSDAAAAKRRHLRELRAELEAPDREVDIGVVLYTVVADPNGLELIPRKPRLRIVGQRVLGGIVDTKLRRPQIIRRTENPRRWFCSVDQLPVIVHGDGDPLGQVVYGSEGAGKTTALVMWLYCRWLENLGAGSEIGITAPVNRRLKHVIRELRKLWPRQWYRHRRAEQVLELCDGPPEGCTRVQLVSTHQQSEAEGSPIQGYSWVACGRDEMQDSVEAHEDIEARGREAPGGRYKQLGTCTAKNSPDWRTFRDRLDVARSDDGEKLWIRRTLYGKQSPFVPAKFWLDKAATMSPRQYARRIDNQDLPPDRATYPEWNRALNMIVVSELWEDVTAHALRASGHGLELLVGHDPNALVHVSLLLKAYRLPKLRRHIWVVRGEVNTERGTIDRHIVDLLGVVRQRWRLNQLDRRGLPVEGGPQMLVRADPSGNNDKRPHKSVYTQFKNHHVRVKPAVWSETHPTKHGRVNLDAGIDMINGLFHNQLDERWLFVELLPNGAPAAPQLVAALENSERDLAGKAETQRKGEGDVSHWPAALRYALWMLEHPRPIEAADYDEEAA